MYKLLSFISVSFLFVVQSSFAQDRGTVTIHADPRLAILLEKPRVVAPEPKEEAPVHAEEPAKDVNDAIVYRKQVVVYSGKGFRVQIYKGSDRTKALAVKADFMRRYPSVHSYLSFVAPSFQVRVGDYKTRGEAEAMMREANSNYRPTMIVPDDITISVLQ